MTILAGCPGGQCGLFHPRCKDSTSTYFEGITTLQPVTKEEQEEMNRREKLAAQEKYYENQAKQNHRIAEHSLDPDNQRTYAHRATVSREKAAEVAEKLEKPVENSGERLKAQFPKGFSDTRHVGKIISEDDLKSFVEKAENLGFGFIPLKNSRYGGFETYCGSNDVLDNMLYHLKENQKLLTELSENGKISIGYDYIKENGTVDVNTFAITKGRTITFNKFFYDDSAFLEKEYGEMVTNGHFAKGTTYLNIPDHECGHILAKINKRYISALKQKCESMAKNEASTYKQFICEHISTYAYFTDNELPAEINAMRFGNNPKFALKLLKEVGLK